MPDNSIGKETGKYERQRNWDKQNVKTYAIHLHLSYDADRIDYVETKRSKGLGVTEIFRSALDALIEQEGK